MKKFNGKKLHKEIKYKIRSNIKQRLTISSLPKAKNKRRCNKHWPKK